MYTRHLSQCRGVIATTPNRCFGKKKVSVTQPSNTAPNTHFKNPHSCAPSSRPNLTLHLNYYVRLSPTLMAIAAVMLFSNIHRQEQPPIAQRALMPGPFVQHGNLETHPAQIFGQVFTSIGFAVQADDQLIAVDAVGTCKLEEGCEAVKEQCVSTNALCCSLRRLLTQASSPVPSPHCRRRRKERARHPAPRRSF